MNTIKFQAGEDIRAGDVVYIAEDGKARVMPQKPKRGSKKFYILRRENPQTGVYFCACGLMTRTAAKRRERAIYGSNTMMPFDTEAEYLDAITRFHNAGERFV